MTDLDLGQINRLETSFPMKPTMKIHFLAVHEVVLVESPDSSEILQGHHVRDTGNPVNDDTKPTLHRAVHRGDVLSLEPVKPLLTMEPRARRRPVDDVLMGFAPEPRHWCRMISLPHRGRSDSASPWLGCFKEAA